MSTFTPSTELQDSLQSVRRRWQRWRLIRTGLQSLVILTGGLWLLWVLDTFFFLTPSWRSGVFFAVFAFAITWLLTRILNLKQESPTDEQLAALIEESHPELEERLLAAVDYQHRPTDSRLEHQLQQTTIRQVVHQMQSLELESSFRPARTARTGMVGLSLLLIAAAFFIVYSDRTAPWRRILTPWHTTSRGPTIVVEEGSRSVPLGETVNLTARLSESTRDADELLLQVHWQTGDQHERTQPLHYDEGTESFSIQWDQVDESREYWITSRNSFDESARYRLEVVEIPRLESAMLRVTPPEYTGLEPTEHDGALGDIEVPEQSDVQLTFTSNQPIASGKVLFRPDDPESVPLEIPMQLTDDRTGSEVKLPSEESGQFSIEFVDENGFAYRDEVRRHLNVSTDAAPVIEPGVITELEDSEQEERQFELPVEANDDYAINDAEMIVKAPDEPARIIRPADRSTKFPGEADFRFEFPLSSEELANASDVEVRFRATDNRGAPRPNEIWTESIPLARLLDSSLLEDPAALDAAADEQLQKSLQDLRDALERQATDVDKLSMRSRLDQSLEGGDRRTPDELIREERQLGLKLETIARQFEEHALYNKLAPMAQHIARHELPKVAEHLQQIEENGSDAPRDALPSLTAARSQLKTTTNRVEQLQEWLDNLIELKKEIPALNEIAHRSEDLADQITAASDLEEAALQKNEGQDLAQEMKDFLTRHPELARATQAALSDRMQELASRIQTAADQQMALNESISDDLGAQQSELRQTRDQNGMQEELTKDQQEELREEIAELHNELNQQQQRAATLALQMAQEKGAASPETKQALELVRQLEQTAQQGFTGQLQEAARSSEQAEQTMNQVCEACQSNGGLSSAAEQLRQTQKRIGEQLKAQSTRPVARHAARQEAQVDLSERVLALEEELNELTRQAVQLAAATDQEPTRLQEKLNTPQQFLRRSEKPMERTSKRLESHDYLLARDTSRDAAQFLRQAAMMLQRAAGSQDEPLAPIPQSFSEQIADAAKQLQRAQQQLSDRAVQAQKQAEAQANAEGQSPLQPGQGQSGPGESGEGQPGNNQTGKPGGQGQQPGQQAGSPSNEPPSGDSPGSSPASQSLQQAAQALNQASRQMQNQAGAGNESGSSSVDTGQQGENATQGDQGGSGTRQTLTAEELQQELDLLSQRPWGSVSTELQSEIREATRYRHKADYAPQIKSYFKQLSIPRRPESFLETSPGEAP